jgi:hypothetical protein
MTGRLHSSACPVRHLLVEDSLSTTFENEADGWKPPRRYGLKFERCRRSVNDG